MSLSLADKKRFLEALKEDEEFRLAVAGLLGFKEILDRITRLEELFVKLEKRQLKLEERQTALEEKFAKLEERFLAIEEEMRETRRVLSAIAHRYGVLTESAFREAMRYVVEKALGVAKISRLTLHDHEGLVYGRPAEIEVDIVIKDDVHILIEVKSRVSRSDVAELHRIGLLYEKQHKVKPRLVIVGGFIDLNAWNIARELGVEIVPAIKEL
ncbi:MAG: PD-(D/E)XK nuclease family protein [Candidatus Nezhaarchaeales archaeon]